MMVNLYLLTMISFLKFTKATNPLSSNPAAVNGILVVCPEESFSITCSHTNTGAQQTRWTLSTSSSCTVIHDGSLPPVCTPFTVSMISNSSGSSLTSTIEATGSVVRGIPFITCQAGGLQSSTLVDSPPVPEVGPIEYSVESATTGRAKFTVHSQGSLGSPVTYTGSVVGGSGSVEVTDHLITVTGLDYTQPHMVTVVAANTHSCPTVGTSNTTVLLLLNFTVSSLTASMMCSTSSLPIRVSWTVVNPGISPNSSVPLTLPPTATPTISYISTGGRNGSTSSHSPYLLTDTVKNDRYTFTVTVSNVAGDYFIASTNNVLADAFEVDQTSVASSNCLTVTISQDCIDDITSGVFSVVLQYAFGVCGDLRVSDYRALLVQMSNHSTCLPVGEGAGDFCYRATLWYQQDTVIDVETNLKFNSCSTVYLQFFLSDGVSYDLDGLESASSVPHLTTATLSCVSTNVNLQGLSNTSCFDGVWSPTELGSCSSISSIIAGWLTGVIIPTVLLVVYLMGTVCGLFVGHHWQRCSEALTNRETWAIVVVVVLAFTFGIGFGILLCYFYNLTSKHKVTDHSTDFKLTDTEKSKQNKSSSPPPPGSLYADPNTVEHQTTPTGVEHALVGAKEKKEEKKVIQHETAPSGNVYVLIDKMKRGSSKKEQPGVVPSSTAKKKGLCYAKVDINTTFPTPKLSPDQDLSCVEYATIEQVQEKSQNIAKST